MKKKLIYLLLTLSAVMAPVMAGQTVSFGTTLVKTDPFPAQEGQNLKVYFKVSNTGNSEAENVSILFKDSYPFSLKEGEKKVEKIGQMFPGQTYYISKELFVAEDCPDGKSSLELEFRRDGFKVSKEIGIDIESEEPVLNIGDIKTLPSEIYPDSEDNKVVFEIVNNGDEKAENVVVTSHFPESLEKISSLSNRDSVGDIQPGQNKKIEIGFDTLETAKEGVKNIPINISYTEGDTEKVKKENIRFFMSGKPVFSLTGSNLSLSRESSKGLELTVKNTGDEKSESTRVRLLDNSDLPLTVDSASSYVGTLEPGEEGKAYFSAKLGKDAEKSSYIVSFEIRGTKNSKVFVQEKTLKIKGEGEKDRGMPASQIGILVSLVLVSGLIFFRGRLSNLL